MCIHVKRVCFFNTVKAVAVLWTYTSTASISSIHVKPKIVGLPKKTGNRALSDFIALQNTFKRLDKQNLMQVSGGL